MTDIRVPPDVASQCDLIYDQRQIRINEVFGELKAQEEDKLVSQIAGTVLEIVEDYYSILCYMDVKLVADALVKLSIGSIHFWYSEAKGHVHAVTVLRTKERLIFIDLSGHRRLNIETGITVLNRGGSHSVFGNSNTEQSMTSELTEDMLQTRMIGYPAGDEVRIGSLNEMFDI